MLGPFVTNPVEYPRPLNVNGESVTVLASGSATGGYELFLQQGPAGAGAPPHHHDWDESFYVTKGEVHIGLANEMRVAGPGTIVHVPAGTIHSFAYGKDGGEMISMTSRLGASKFFADLDRDIPPGPPDIEKLLGVAGRNGVTITL